MENTVFIERKAFKYKKKGENTDTLLVGVFFPSYQLRSQKGKMIILFKKIKNPTVKMLSLSKSQLRVCFYFIHNGLTILVSILGWSFYI